MKVECADRLDPAEAAAWDSVAGAARLRCPFLGWTWQTHWAAVFAEGRRLDVRYVRDADGRVLAILPLYETESGALELLGGAEVSDYLDLRKAPPRADPQDPTLRAGSPRRPRRRRPRSRGRGRAARRLPGAAPALARGQGEVHGRADGALFSRRAAGARRARRRRALVPRDGGGPHRLLRVSRVGRHGRPVQLRLRPRGRLAVTGPRVAVTPDPRRDRARPRALRLSPR